MDCARERADGFFFVESVLRGTLGEESEGQWHRLTLQLCPAALQAYSGLWGRSWGSSPRTRVILASCSTQKSLSSSPGARISSRLTSRSLWMQGCSLSSPSRWSRCDFRRQPIGVMGAESQHGGDSCALHSRVKVLPHTISLHLINTFHLVAPTPHSHPNPPPSPFPVAILSHSLVQGLLGTKVP